MMYADDICLLAPSASAMQSLLDVCYDYGSDNDILFNAIKSKCTIFKPKAYKLYLSSVFIGSNALTLYDPGGGGFKSSPPPLSFFTLTHLILELHYCALETFPKNSLTLCGKKKNFDWGS